MQLRLAVLCSATACASAAAPAPPAAPAATSAACAPALPLLAKQHTRNVTRLYLAPASFDTTLHLGTPVPVSSKTGFVSQPGFAPDGSGLYFTWRPEGSQADIWYRDLRTGVEHPVTCTSTEEYSARPIEGGLSVIRIEPDLTRHLVRLTADGHDRDVLFASQPNIGAYNWLDASIAALFITPATPDGDPSVVLGDARTGQIWPLVEKAGPAVSVIPNSHDISYVDMSDQHWRLMRLDLTTRSTKLIAPLPEGVDHVTWLPDGSYLAYVGTRIMRASPDAPKYRLVANLAGAVEGNVTGLLLSPDRTRAVIATSVP